MSHPKHHKGHLIVEDLDEGPGILSLETGEHTPITFQEQEHLDQYGQMTRMKRTYRVGEHKGESHDELLRKFADEKHKEHQRYQERQRYHHEGQHRNAEHQEGQSRHGADEEIAEFEKMLRANREVMDAAERLLEKMKEAAGK